MAFRLAGQAASRIDDVVRESARRRGVDAASRYQRLIFVAMAEIGENPNRVGASPIPRIPGLWSWHLCLARHLVEPGQRVQDPRHLVVYPVTSDGPAEILSLVHDRMNLARAARRARREADG